MIQMIEELSNNKKEIELQMQFIKSENEGDEYEKNMQRMQIVDIKAQCNDMDCQINAMKQ